MTESIQWGALRETLHSREVVGWRKNCVVLYEASTGRVATRSVLRQDARSKRWRGVRHHGEPPSPRHGAAVAVVADTLIVTGGLLLSNALSAELFVLPLKAQDPTWLKIAVSGVPKPLCGARAVPSSQGLLLIGGLTINDGLEPNLSFFTLPFDSGEWSRLTDVPKLPEMVIHPIVSLQEGGKSTSIAVYGGYGRDFAPNVAVFESKIRQKGGRGWTTTVHPMAPSPFLSYFKGVMYCVSFNVVWRLETEWKRVYSLDLPAFVHSKFFASLLETQEKWKTKGNKLGTLLGSHFTAVELGGPITALVMDPGNEYDHLPKHLFCFNVSTLICSYVPSGGVKIGESKATRPKPCVSQISQNTQHSLLSGTTKCTTTTAASQCAAAPPIIPIQSSTQRKVMKEVLKNISVYHKNPTPPPTQTYISGGGVGYFGYDVQEDVEVAEVSSTHVLYKELKQVRNGVLDLTSCDATPEMMYVLAMCVNFGEHKIHSVHFRDGTTFAPQSAKLVLSMVQMNRSITELTFPETAVASSSISRLIRQQLNHNSTVSQETNEKAMSKKKKRVLDERLYQDRARREWYWVREREKIVLENDFHGNMFAAEEEAVRVCLFLQGLSWLEELKLCEQQHLVAIQEHNKVIEALRLDRINFSSNESVPREEIHKAERKQYGILVQIRLEDRRKQESQVKERLRKERQLREDICGHEKGGRSSIKEDEIRIFKGMAREFKAIFTRLDNEWKRKLQQEREEERHAKEEQARIKREQEARHMRYERWRDQQRREQQSILREENTDRYTTGNQEQDERRCIQNAAVASKAEYLQLEEEGVARRNLAELNFTAPTLKLALPEKTYCQVTHSSYSPTLTLAGTSLDIHMPIPTHLVEGRSYQCDKETADEFFLRKTTPINGRILVYISSAYYHPTSSIQFFSDIEKNDARLHYLSEEGLIVLGHTKRERIGKVLNILKPRDIWRYEGHQPDECPPAMEGDESCYGMEILLDSVGLPYYEKVLQNIGIRCEKQTPINEMLSLMISIDIAFVAPSTQGMQPSILKSRTESFSPVTQPLPGQRSSFLIELPPSEPGRRSSFYQGKETTSFATLDIQRRVPKSRKVSYNGEPSVVSTAQDLIFGQDLFEDVTQQERENPTSLDKGRIVSHVVSDVQLQVILGSFTPPPASDTFTYVEGDAPLRMFKGSAVESVPDEIHLKILNCDDDDMLSCKAPGVIKSNGSVRVEGKEVGTAIKRDRFRIVIKPSEAANVTNLTLLLESLCYENNSEDPAPEERTVQLSFQHDDKINTRANVLISVVPEDDPTVVDWGCVCMPYRKNNHQTIDSLLPYSETPVDKERFCDKNAYFPNEHLHFSALASVTDVDTEVFRTGLLIVRTQSYVRGDDILLFPPKSSQITRCGVSVLHKGAKLGTLSTVEDHPEGVSIIISENDSSSISKLNALIKCFIFTTQSNREGVRTVEATLYIDEYNPVKSSCQVRVTGSLVTVLPENQTILYRENSGPVPLGPFELPQLDDGWDGGFVHIEVVEGATSEDSIKFSPSQGELTEGDSVDHPGSSATVSLKDKMKAHAKMGQKEQGAASFLKSAATPVRPHDMRLCLQQEMKRRNISEKKVEMREIRDKARPLATFANIGNGVLVHTSVSVLVANSDTASRSDNGRVELCSIKKANISQILSQIVYCNTAENPKVTKKVIAVSINDGLPHCSRIYLEVSIQPTHTSNLLRRKGNETLNYRQGQVDASHLPLFQDLCLHQQKKELNYAGCYLIAEPVSGGDVVGDQIGFLSISEQDSWFEKDRKRLNKLAEERDLLMKESTVNTLAKAVGGKKEGPFSINSVLNSEKAASSEEAHTPHPPAAAKAKKGREVKKPKSPTSKSAFASKDGGVNISDRRKHMAMNPSDRVYVQERDGELFSTTANGASDRKIGTFTCDDVTSAIKILFDTNIEVSSDLAEVCLWCIAYHNTSAKVKQNTIILQLRAKPPDTSTDARSKVTLKVHPPFLWAPEYSKSVTYTEGDQWVTVNPKLTANVPLNAEGKLEVTVTTTTPPDEDKTPDMDDIKWVFSDTDFIMKGDSLFKGKDIVGVVNHKDNKDSKDKEVEEEVSEKPGFAATEKRYNVAGASQLRLEFVSGFKLSSKLLTAILKCLSFRSNVGDHKARPPSSGIAAPPNNRITCVEVKYTDKLTRTGTVLRTSIFKKLKDETSSHVLLNLKKQPVSYTLATGRLYICPHSTLQQLSPDETPTETVKSRLLSVFLSPAAYGDVIELGTEAMVKKHPELLVEENRIHLRKDPENTLATIKRLADASLDIQFECGVTQRHVEIFLRHLFYTNMTMRQRNSRRCVYIRVDSGEAKIIQLELIPAYLDFSFNASVKTIALKKKGHPWNVQLLGGVKVNIKDTPDTVLIIDTEAPVTFSLLPSSGLHLLPQQETPVPKELKVEGNYSRASKGKVAEKEPEAEEGFAESELSAFDTEYDENEGERERPLQDNVMHIIADGKVSIGRWEIETVEAVPEEEPMEASQNETESRLSDTRGEDDSQHTSPTSPASPALSSTFPKSQSLIVRLPSLASKVCGLKKHSEKKNCQISGGNRRMSTKDCQSNRSRSNRKGIEE